MEYKGVLSVAHFHSRGVLFVRYDRAYLDVKMPTTVKGQQRLAFSCLVVLWVAIPHRDKPPLSHAKQDLSITVGTSMVVLKKCLHLLLSRNLGMVRR